MKKVRIFTSNVGSSTYGKVEKMWYVKTISDNNYRHIDDLTGWISTENSENQFKLKFETKEAAINYAKEKGYQYTLQEDRELKIKPKSYADNFLKS